MIRMITNTSPLDWDKMVASNKTTLHIPYGTTSDMSQLEIEMNYDYDWYLKNIDHLEVEIFENSEIATEKYKISDEHGVIKACRRFDKDTGISVGTIKMLVYYCYK